MGDKVKRGFYLVTIAHCLECHTPFGPPGTGVDFGSSLGKGGREFHGPWGASVSRNITSSRTKGIGDWSDAEIKRAITQGVRKDGSKLKPPMGFALLRQDDRAPISTRWSPICARCRRRSDVGGVRRRDLILKRRAKRGPRRMTEPGASACCQGRCRSLLFLPPHAFAHHVVEVDRREIVGDEFGAGGLRRQLVDAPLQDRRQRIAKAVALLQRRRPARPASPCPAAARRWRPRSPRRRRSDRDRASETPRASVRTVEA